MVSSETSEPPEVKEEKKYYHKCEGVCAFCQDPLSDNSAIVRLTNCGHIYHLSCLQTQPVYSESIYKCALCRKKNIER